jgi:superfamily II DNA/RNA helicase
MPFSQLMLSSKTLQTIDKLGYDTPTEIQKRAIPLLIQGRDILATSQTGTGKTAAFLLPMLENLKILKSDRTAQERYKIQALVLVPTRELTLQVHAKFKSYSEHFEHKSVALYGGIKLGSQVKEIRAGATVAIATTGRLLDHIKNKTVDLTAVEIVVLDEADKMLEMGFIDEIRTIISKLPKITEDKKRQSLMFSATFPPSIMKLAKSFLHNPITIEIDKENLSTKQVEQIAHHVKREEKITELLELIKLSQSQQILIFANTKVQVDHIVTHLKTTHIKVMAIHGNKSQGMRIEALKAFKEKNIRVLVATDVAARGIDIINLPEVINFELPINNEDYIHRIGRTGRANQKGIAHSLISEEEREQLEAIELLINKKLSSQTQIPKKEKSKREKSKKEGVDLKKAKALAEKMMGKENIDTKSKKKKGKPGGQKPSNRRLF